MTEHAVVLARKNELCETASKLPALVSRAGPAAVFAVEEFFHGKIRNPYTRTAYERAVRKFLEWCDDRGLELHTVRPKDVGEYMDGLGSLSKKQQHLSALRHFTERDGSLVRWVEEG